MREVAPCPAPPGFGESLPFFAAETDGIELYSIDVAAGRWIVLMPFRSLTRPGVESALKAIEARAALFNDTDAAFYGLSTDPADRFQRGLANAPVGRRFFWDFDAKVAPLFGAAPRVLLIDRGFRIVMSEPVENTPAVLDRLGHEIAAEPPLEQSPHAPILTLPRVFEPEFCEALVGYFKAHAPEVSGFAATQDGRTVTIVNARFKRRLDVTIEDQVLVATISDKLRRRLFPAVKRAFGWQASEIERFLLCRYGEDDQGFFASHRDDATAGTAHRKFAVTINLNTGAYDGGALRFPEFGRRTYAPPTGGATVFCCSLLHEVIPVSRGERFCFVPFLYDEDGERIRRRNLALVGDRAPPRLARRMSRDRR
jgi:predicted 2-oxoglutarate/Fe(II)-dependent dioxygenase YbiX/peroxiredoxin